MLSNNLQAEECTSSEIPENKPEKKRFKLDKKRIQGFIVGILLCSIAFTGLYYGTNGLFFAGTLTGSNLGGDNLRAKCHECDFEVWIVNNPALHANIYTAMREHLLENANHHIYYVLND